MVTLPHLLWRSANVITKNPKLISNDCKIYTAASEMGQIKEGSKLPSVELFEESNKKVNIAELCSGKKSIIFGLPGAFTPVCSSKQLPSFVEKSDELKAQGVTEIICTSVNDPFVMNAWGKEQNAPGKVRMLADPKGDFAKAINLTDDLPHLGGLRSKRYSMLIDDGVVKQLNIERESNATECSLANHIKVN